MTTISADETDLLNSLARQAMVTPPPAPEKTSVDESSLEIPDVYVTLPGGYVSDGFSVVNDAEIRELNGHDEEAIAKSNNRGRALLTILERGTVAVGEERSNRRVLDGLLMGDRDALLLAIYRATFGTKAPVQQGCVSCGENQSLEIDLTKDVPTITFEDALNDRFFTVDCRIGEVRVTLPTGATHRDLIMNSDHSVAEMNTKMLADCLQTINGTPAMGIADAKKLGIADRQKITEEISKRNPGPRLDQIKKSCPSCGEVMEVPLSITALFRI